MNIPKTLKSCMSNNQSNARYQYLSGDSLVVLGFTKHPQTPPK